MFTYSAKEKKLQKAIKAISKLDYVKEKPLLIRTD